MTRVSLQTPEIPVKSPNKPPLAPYVLEYWQVPSHDPRETGFRARKRNINVALPPHPLAQDKWYRRARWHNSVLESSLRELGRAEEADKVHGCWRSFYVQVHTETGEHRIKPHSCHNRLCVFCNRKRARRELRLYGAAIKRMDRRVHITLTFPSVPVGHLGEGQTRRVNQFRRLRSRSWWRHLVKGGLWSFEVTFNRATGMWHPHIHVLAEVTGWVPKDLLHREWESITGMWSTHVGFARNPREIVKYPTKPSNFLDIPEAVGDFLDALHNRTLIHGFGSFLRFVAEFNAGHDESSWRTIGVVHGDARILIDARGGLHWLPPVGWRWRKSGDGGPHDPR